MEGKPKIAIVVDRPSISARAEGKVLWGYDYSLLAEKWRKAGIADSEVELVSAENPQACAEFLNDSPELRVVVPTGEASLKLLTGKSSLTKWHLSPLDSLPTFNCRKAVPTFHPDSIKKDFRLGLYVDLAFRRVKEEMATVDFSRKEKRFLLNPTLEETHATLDMLESLDESSWLSVDIETGRGLINTMGFAWSIHDAIAIQVLPSRFTSAKNFTGLWRKIARVLQGPTKKVMQNGIYERLYCARYGIYIENFAHDTMAAQKFLWPEFEKGLDNVGRFYTKEPYWKDTGRIESEEGKRKDWGDIKDWSRHLTYNCLDTTGTLEGALNQRKDLQARGQLAFFDNYLMKLHLYMSEMCLRGLPVCLETQRKLIAEYDTKVAELSAGLSVQFKRGKAQKSAITRAQKLKLLKDKGYAIPKNKNKSSGNVGESVDELSLKKILQKHPDDPDIPKLLKIAEYEKALSSYFRVSLDPFDNRVRFMMDVHGTETGRWSSTTDAWSRGFNAQTMPKYVKKMIRWEA